MLLLSICLVVCIGLIAYLCYKLLLKRVPLEQSDGELRGTLARQLTTWAAAFIAGLGAFILLFAGGFALNSPSDKEARADFFNIAQYVLGTLLPVVASWVGTVLAFYFGKANFEAAAKNAASLVRELTPREKLLQKVVKEVMRPLDEMQVFRMPTGQTEANVTIRSLIKDGFEKDPQNPVNRLPILDAQSIPKFLLHRSVVDSFLADQKNAGSNPPITEDTLTLQQLVTAPRQQELLAKSFLVIADTATLAEAKDLLDKNPRCLDILVTKDGTTNSEVMGWLTNNRILEESSI